MKTLTATQLALYLGCKAITTKLTYSNPEPGTLDYINQHDNEVSIMTKEGYYLCQPSQVKPILRRFSYITDEEAIKLGFPNKYEAKCYNANFNPRQVVYLLSIGIDLFNWIEQGLAIDATLALN